MIPVQEWRFAMARILPAILVLAALLRMGGVKAEAETVVDSKGTSAACVSLILPLGKKCISLFESAGLISVKDLGYSGITFTLTGPDDGAIASVATRSAADAAGLQAGDRILTVNGKPAAHSLPEIAEMMIFGPRGETVKLRVMRGATPMDVELTRDPLQAPPGPESGSSLMYVKPMINWKGEFMPCAGAGPTGMAAVEFCWAHFKNDGYIRVTELGTTGLTFDKSKPDGAWIQTVAPGSAAEKAGLRAGDRLVQVDGSDLKESVGEAIQESLFARKGTRLTIVFLRNSAQQTVVLTLGSKK
ncbi:MAG: PDZ domain-containing protein [Terracidiphilus sp.]